jgi:hypothetical protein
MLGAAPKELIVIEIEVDDFAIPVHREASKVVADIAVPVDSKPAGAIRHVATIARHGLRQLRQIFLLRPERISPERPAFIAIPKPSDQLHQKMAVDAMPLASGGIRKIRRILPQIDLYDLIKRLVPKLDERLLDIEAGRYWLLALRRCRRSFHSRDSSSRANRPCSPHDETAPVDLVVSAHGYPPTSCPETTVFSSIGDARPSNVLVLAKWIEAGLAAVRMLTRRPLPVRAVRWQLPDRRPALPQDDCRPFVRVAFT